MEPTPELIQQLYDDKVEAARRQSFESKFLGGPRLFDFVCRLNMDGIRNQYPDADEVAVRQMLRERLMLARRIENGRS